MRAKANAKRAGARSDGESAWSLEWTYVAFVLLVWCFTPLLRRLIDWRSGGFNATSFISLLPFLVALPLALVCFRRDRWSRLAPLLKMCLAVWLAIFAYGFLVAVVFGNELAAGFSLVQYCVPMLPGIWLAGQGGASAASLRRLLAIVLPLGLIVAVYGIAQYVQPAPWDVLWVEGSQFTSAGAPVPFSLRIFSTLNSPGPAANFFELILLFALPSLRPKNLWSALAASILGAALLLTLVREAWIGLLVGCAIYLACSPLRMRVVPVLGAFAVIALFFIASLPTLLGAEPSSDVLSARVSSIGDTDHDESAIARRQEIGDALDKALSSPFGSGLGTTGAAARLGSNPESILGNNLDSGYLARFIELGLPGIAGYLFVVIGGVGLAVRAALPASGGSAEDRTAAAVAAAVCGALLWSDAAGDAHYGLNALLFWIALGLGSLASVRPSRNERVAA